MKIMPLGDSITLGVSLVDMYGPLNPAKDLVDGVHPNQGGYVKMGDVWFKAIQELFPLAKPASADAGK